MTAAPAATLEAVNETDCLVTLGDTLDSATNNRVHWLAAQLQQAGLPGLVDIIPAYNSLLLRGRPDQPSQLAFWQEKVTRLLSQATTTTGVDGQLHRIPVTYNGDDLAAVAQHCQLSVDEVIQRHSQAEYRVAMIGFAPGFPYLLGMDPALTTPRHTRPRTRVPAGSVAIGGQQTGIYPRHLPGGWQLIGHTDITLFDPQSASPCRLKPGDRVQFVVAK